MLLQVLPYPLLHCLVTVPVCCLCSKTINVSKTRPGLLGSIPEHLVKAQTNVVCEMRKERPRSISPAPSTVKGFSCRISFPPHSHIRCSFVQFIHFTEEQTEAGRVLEFAEGHPVVSDRARIQTKIPLTPKCIKRLLRTGKEPTSSSVPFTYGSSKPDEWSVLIKPTPGPDLDLSRLGM